MTRPNQQNAQVMLLYIWAIRPLFRKKCEQLSMEWDKLFSDPIWLVP